MDGPYEGPLSADKPEAAIVALLVAAVLGALALLATGHPWLAVLLLVVVGLAVVAYYLKRRKKQ